MSIVVRKSRVANEKAANENAPINEVSSETGVQEALQAFEPVIQMRSTRELRPNPRNARQHPAKQIQQLQASIKTFGFTVPILIDEEDMILAGHGRWEAARGLGMSVVPTVAVKHLTPDLKRAFVIAENRLAQLSAWDEVILKDELQALAGPEITFDFEVTGFDTVDLDRLDEPAAAKPKKSAEPEVVPEIDREAKAVSALGDLWQLGRHRLLCGDALQEASYQKLLGDDLAQMVFTDPPYNVKIDGHVCGLGAIKHQEFKMASGEMSEAEFAEFLGKAMRLMADCSADGSIHFACMDWRHMNEMLVAAAPVYGRPKNLCVWNKTNAGMGTFYRSKHELVFAFKKGTAAHINTFGLGDRGRYRTNVWDYPGVNTFSRTRMQDLADHPTVKPLALVVDAIKDCSKRGGIVLDPFSGSGTTLLAAEKTGRIGRGLELDPLYVDAAIRRWQAQTGEMAVHLATGQTFEQRAVPAREAA